MAELAATQETAAKAGPPANGAAGPQNPVKPATQQAGEVPPPAASPAPSPDKDERFAALTRKESALVARQLELKAESERLAADRAEYDKFKALKAGAKLRPLHALKEALGLTFEEVQQAALSGGAPSPEVVVATVQDQLDAFEAKQAAKEKAADETRRTQAKAAHEASVQKWRGDVVGFVKEKAAEYEIISAFDAADMVHQRIEKHFADTCQKDDAGNVIKAGVLLSNKEAADIVESELVELVKKAQASKKLQPQPPVKAIPPPGFTVDGKRSDVVQPRTISNDMTVSTPAAFSSANSEDEAMQRALAALNRVRK